MHDHRHRQEYLFHPNNRSQTLSHHHQVLQHRDSNSSDMRTPVAWTLRDATLSHPRSPAVGPGSGVPYGMSHNHHHPFDSISMHQSSSISGRDQPPHRLRHHQQHPNQQMHYNPYPKSKHHMLGNKNRTSSPSATTTSSDDREEIPIVRHPRDHHRRHNHSADGRRSVISRVSHMNHGMGHQHQLQLVHPQHGAYDHRNPYGITMGTMRSTKSVPALHRDHDNCPVHGAEFPMFPPPASQRPHPTGAYSVIHAPIYADRRMLAANSVMDLRSLPPIPGNANTMQQPALITNYEAKKLQTAIQLPLPAMYPGNRHLMMQSSSAGGKLCSPLDLSMYAAAGNGMTSDSEPNCCKGHLIVLWIILSVVMMGVISGIILGVTMN